MEQSLDFWSVNLTRWSGVKAIRNDVVDQFLPCWPDKMI